MPRSTEQKKAASISTIVANLPKLSFRHITFIKNKVFKFMEMAARSNFNKGRKNE